MIQIIVPLGAGLIISIAGYMYKKKAVERWFKARRIDMLPSKRRDLCGVCGKEMIIKKRNADTYLVCSDWPRCRKKEKIEIEETFNKKY